MHFVFKDETSCRFGVVWLCGEKEENTGLHADALASSGVKVPKSFVFSRGKLPALLRNLEKDVWKVMMPHTALNLRVRIMLVFDAI
jgi:hypothetical protein